MSEGKVSMALRLLSKDSKGGVLSLDSMIPCGVIHREILYIELLETFY